MYLSRITLRQDTALRALNGMFIPDNPDARVASSHKLMWSLFGDHEERTSDFLWRETGEGAFLALSHRMPHDEHNMFEIAHKPFSPVFQEGQKLRVLLRANATVSTKERGARTGHREDIVTRALREFRAQHGSATSEQRETVVAGVSYHWLARKGRDSGFVVEPEEFAVESTGFMSVPHGKGPMKFGVIDMTANVTVGDPESFKQSLVRGFGRSKAYGCGLMLVRPVQ